MGPSARRDGILTREVGEDLVVYDETTHRVHSLNRTAALVWQHCDGRTSVDELARLLSAKGDRAASEEILYATLAELSEAELLTTPVAVPSGRQLTRKQLLLVAAGLGLLVPVIESIVAPSRAAALTI